MVERVRPIDTAENESIILDSFSAEGNIGRRESWPGGHATASGSLNLGIVLHPAFIEPDENATLWRYLDLAKFCALITGKELWFSNVETLGKEDPHEGVFPGAYYAHRRWQTEADVPSPDLEIIRQTSYGKKDDIEYKIAREKDMRDSNILNSLFHRRSFFVNCWHLADHESSAMWDIYAARGSGVAVKVRYIDPTIEAITTNGIFELVVIKRHNYIHESEVLLVYLDSSLQDTMPKPRWRPDLDRFEMLSDDHPFLQTPFQAGRNFSCALPELIEDIWISHRAPPWFAETVARLCKLAGLNNRIERSTLLDPPGVKKACRVASPSVGRARRTQGRKSGREATFRPDARDVPGCRLSVARR
jgi:hypothetical protein